MDEEALSLLFPEAEVAVNSLDDGFIAAADFVVGVDIDGAGVLELEAERRGVVTVVAAAAGIQKKKKRTGKKM